MRSSVTQTQDPETVRFFCNVDNDLELFENKEGTKRYAKVWEAIVMSRRVLIFPPVNDYRRFLIHATTEKFYSDNLTTFSIGQGFTRRTVVCYKSDVIRDPKLNGVVRSTQGDSSSRMGVEDRHVPSALPDNSRQRQGKSPRADNIYRPPAARRAQNSASPSLNTMAESAAGKTRQRRPDRAVYVPKHRRSTEAEGSPQHQEEALTVKAKTDRRSKSSNSMSRLESCDKKSEELVDSSEVSNEPEAETTCPQRPADVIQDTAPEVIPNDQVINNRKETSCWHNSVSDVLKISTCESSPWRDISEEALLAIRLPEKKLKKVARAKSKPASPPGPTIKVNRDECDWDSLFDDNGECLDPTLIEELTAAVGEVTIEQPQNDYKAFTRSVEFSSDELAHVVEIYNFPSDFKTSDLAAVLTPFQNSGFELRWVDNTHCLAVFSSSLVAAQVLESDHPFVKTRPLCQATTLSKIKARRSAEFMQPYRSRPETCPALARRLVTGALGVRLATARQEREREKVVLQEAKEKRRLAKKQCEDVWAGIITPK